MLTFGRDTHARIGNLEAQHVVACPQFKQYGQYHPAALGKLERVGQEVEKNLTQARWIARDPGGDVGRDRDIEGEAFFKRRALDERHGTVSQAGRTERDRLQIDLPRLDLG